MTVITCNETLQSCPFIAIVDRSMVMTSLVMTAECCIVGIRIVGQHFEHCSAATGNYYQEFMTTLGNVQI